MICSRSITSALTAALLTGAAALNCFGQQDTRGLITQVRSGTALDGRGKLWAVIIGVSRYKNVPPESQLRFAHRDAQEFANLLRSPNGGGFPSDQIKLLLNQDATISAVRTALGTWLPRSAEPDDVVYIYFAGHGVVENEREGYLLAHDSDPQNLYATALQVADLDRIITERLRARVVVLIADACHSGRIGWTSRGAEGRALINRYLDEIGKSGSGVLRLLASRPDERSYEDVKWGGGHGAFTYFLLEGLRGLADKDGDDVVRAGELLQYLSTVVPEETKALQHPRAAGHIEAQMPIAIVSAAERGGPDSSGALSTASIEVRGVPETEVYLNNAYRGRIRPNGVLVIEGVQAGIQELSVAPPNAESFAQKLKVSAGRVVLELKAPSGAGPVSRSSPLVAQIKETLSKKLVLEPGGAWALYQRLASESPREPQRPGLETSLVGALEEIGQQAINDYVNSSVTQLRSDLFHRGALAFSYLKQLNKGDSQLEAKYLFCEGRALIVDGKPEEALRLLGQAVSLDPRAAHAYNALGVATERTSGAEKSLDAFKRAAELAPNWLLPRLHIGIFYYNRDKLDRAEEELRTATQLDRRFPLPRLILARIYIKRGRHPDAERELATILTAFPNYAPAYAELGVVYEARRDYAKAADAFETYLRLASAGDDSGGYDRQSIRERAEQNRRKAKQPTLKRQPERE